MILERWFHCHERGTTWETEVMAGVSTFLALSYIFVVNPSILGQAGMPREAVFFATIVTSAVATLAMGFWTNLPFVLAPGLEINAYVAFYAVKVAGLTWQEALGAVFWSGLLFVIFTLTGIRQGIIDSMPDAIKSGLAAAVAALLAAVALRITGVLDYEGVVLSGFGSLGNPVTVLLATTAIVFTLAALRIRAAVLISIIAGSIVAAFFGVATEGAASTRIAGSMLGAIGAADLTIIARPNVWAIILVLFLVDFYGSVAKLVGLIRNTELIRNGKVPRIREALLIDGAAATTGSLLGTTSVLVYAESGVGIAAGGRTGLTAVTAGLAMLACFTAAPFLVHIPVAATSGALLYVAYRLLPTPAELRSRDVWELTAILGMVSIVFTTFALDRALLFGLVLHLLRDFFKGVRLNAYALGSLGLLMIGWALSS